MARFFLWRDAGLLEMLAGFVADLVATQARQ
jgi:hypothetical protein